MKFLSLSTTSKLYLLTLLVIFGIIFLNRSVLAQDGKSTTEKRLGIMERYQSWIDSGEYGGLKDESGKKVFNNFKAFLSKAIPEDKNCLTTPPPAGGLQTSQNSTFIQNINNFFQGLTGQTQTPPQLQAQNCTSKILDDYKLAKKYNRALKYLQIEAGQPNICVQADLGVGTALKAKGFNPVKAKSDNPKETGRSEPLQVYLCTGNDGKKKVRAVDDSGTRLRLAPEEATKDQFKVENLPPKGAFEELLKKLGS